ncbi:Vacuolar protein sorting-associated protein 41 [Myotisia sp. PD_48]|nr:Vacuolar protein sorting-associated protein 41 [Myotisia sp. PD_48]
MEAAGTGQPGSTSAMMQTTDPRPKRKPANDEMQRAGDKGGETDKSEEEDEGDEDGEEIEHEDYSDNEDGDEEEPRLKYTPITTTIGSVYSNRDATSTFMAAGNKMIIGTHNGNIHVYTLPVFQRLRVYHAHSASVTSISVSPFPAPMPSKAEDYIIPRFSDGGVGSSPSNSVKGSKQSRQAIIPATPSNSIYVATSSVDGNVCVASLVDPKDVTIRNFGRPIEAVALSPEYKSDRTYVSGGRAGSLVLTVGGRIGATSNSTTAGASSTNPSGWFGSLGLGSGNGKDKILHSGEGAISMIKWSRSGKYIAWANEQGIKIMRTHLHLEIGESDNVWQRFGHIDRPRTQVWDEMASLWKPRAVWIDENALEQDNASPTVEVGNASAGQELPPKKQSERLLVGWGGTIWIIKVSAGDLQYGTGIKRVGSAEIVNKLRTDCIISGVSLYTQNLLLVLSYIIPESDDDADSTQETGPSRGIRRRHNGLQPELSLIDLHTEEELSSDTIVFHNYESLSASDYHLDILPPNRAVSPAHRGALETITAGILDATLYPTRLFNSGASARSKDSSGDKASSFKASGSIDSASLLPAGKYTKEVEFMSAPGIKILIHSPYDCTVAVKRGIEDRLAWFSSHEQFEDAWELFDQNSDALRLALDSSEPSPPATPTAPRDSSAHAFDDDRSSIRTISHRDSTNFQREKSRIGHLWLKQLIGNGEWEKAGAACTKVLQSTSAWEHWIWVFVRAQKFDEIAPHIPFDIHPPLPSLIYEVILGHYVSRDHVRFSGLIDTWPLHLFDVDSVIAAIEDQLNLASTVKGAEDWQVLSGCLGKLLLAAGHYREALRCYVRLQDSETVMLLIREHHLLDSIAEDIPGFLLLRVSKDQIESMPISELEEATSELIKLLVREAANGIVRPETVVSQLKDAGLDLFLYFYVRALWRGDFSSSVKDDKTISRVRGRQRTRAEASKLAADEGRLLIEPFSDTVVELFAKYDRPLLMDFLKSSTSYSYTAASSICEARHFTLELVYLLSKTGQTKRALQLILSDLQDISRAISFAKTQNDSDLWDDLLSYSMDKPEYIRALLTEASTAIDPIKLVRRIPSGLEIEGLREGLTRMIREYDIQASISQGVARVLAGEVAIRTDALRKGQRQGIKFDIVSPEAIGPNIHAKPPQQNGHIAEGKDQLPGDDEKNYKPTIPSSQCAGCHQAFVEQETKTLVGFACGHIYHLAHLHPPNEDGEETEEEEGQPKDTLETEPSIAEAFSPFLSRTVNHKVINARLLRDKIGAGCRLCVGAVQVGV